MIVKGILLQCNISYCTHNVNSMTSNSFYFIVIIFLFMLQPISESTVGPIFIAA